VANNFNVARDIDVASSWVVLYTGPGSGETVVQNVSFTNTSAAARTVSMRIRDNGDSSTLVTLMTDIPVPVASTFIYPTFNMGNDEKISIEADNSSGIDAQVSVLEIT
jgi:hypothetical protein